ncbi:MAG: hypothetical protein ACREVP_12490 [Burkholderiales bacterium]
MSRVRWFAILAMAACLTPATAGETDGAARPAKLRFDPQFILAEVARRMNVTLRPEIPVPAVFFESTTPLRQFQDAIGAQWQFRPHVFTNAYAASRNEIYLIDEAAYYEQVGRTLDDSLAHELAHYLQVHYLKADLADHSLEIDAVAVQRGFEQDHLYPKRAEARK